MVSDVLPSELSSPSKSANSHERSSVLLTPLSSRASAFTSNVPSNARLSLSSSSLLNSVTAV